jgi:GTP pyrophosphokinase
MLQFEDVLQRSLDLKPSLDPDRLTRAYKYTDELTKGKYRLSGDPYVIHPLAVFDILLSISPDEDTLVAGLLHGISKSSNYDEEEVKVLFGENVAFLNSAVDNLDMIKSRDENAEAESIRGMFVTMAKDLRVILIKLADRLHNMQTISFHSLAKQKRIAKETMDIYVPISARLGIYSIKGKLEDLAFETLFTNQHEHLKKEMDEYMAERKSTIHDIKEELTSYLKHHNIEAKVEGRVKNLYSIYNKLKLKNHSTLNDIHDVYAIRVVVPNKYDELGNEQNDHLYGVLGLIHSKWTPMAQRFKDYVAVPKPNGYQSLHTAVLGLSPKSSQTTEIQLRTGRMHEEAEYGVASH